MRAFLIWTVLLCLSAQKIMAEDYCLESMRTHAQGTVLILGDSLSAGYGIDPTQAWPALAKRDLAQQKVCVLNASVSGETTAGGLARLPALLRRHQPTLVLLALGANDGLRGLDPAEMAGNLAKMAQLARASSAKVLLVGIRLPPNYGLEYNQAFEQSFRDVAKAQNSGLLEFLLAPIALDDTAFQADRLHPTASAQPAIWQHVRPALLKVLAPQ